MANFANVIALVKTEFDALRPGEIATFHNGRNLLSEQRGPGDVVWVSEGGTFDSHPGSGPGFHDGTEATSPMLKDRVVRFECYMWADDEGTAEDYMTDMIRSLDRALSWRNFDVTEYTDITEQALESGYTWHGRSFVLSGTMRLMMPREKWTTVEIEERQLSGEYDT